MRAALPPDEEKRLAKLRHYGILDTEREPGFEDVVLLASLICETPIAAISLIDRERQWFKASIGLGISETVRDLAFCAHAILTPEITIVPDVHRDERFADNPLANDEPPIRFYAGAPIVTPEGYSLGTVCVIDRAPRHLSPRQSDALRALARLAMMLIELRHRAVGLTLAQAQS